MHTQARKRSEKIPIQPVKIMNDYKKIIHNDLKRKLINKICRKTGLKKATVRSYLTTGFFTDKHKMIVNYLIEETLKKQNKKLYD